MKAFMSFAGRSGARVLLAGLPPCREIMVMSAVDEACRILLEVEPLDWWRHTYHGAADLRKSAEEISVNGLTPAGFVVSAREALIEALTRFVE